MDYQLFRNILSPYLVDNMSGIQEVKKYVDSLSVDDAFDKKFLTVLNNIISCFETNEAIKSLALNILEEADFFSDTSIHKTTKSKYLDKILSDSDYIEHTKSFNLSVIQTYVEKILHKQLYEINIKIEENQRSLNKMEASSGKMREEVQQANLAVQQVNKIKQQANQQPLASIQNGVNNPLSQRVQQQKTTPAITDTIASSSQQSPLRQQQTHQAALTPNNQQVNQIKQNSLKEIQASPSIAKTQPFLLVELDQEQCAIPYGEIVEILKSDKPVPEKILKFTNIPYNKLVGFARSFSVLRKISNIQIDKKCSFNNLNAVLPNNEDKRFGIIITKNDGYNIIFVDYIVYAEPIDGQELGDGKYIKTVEGEYRIIN